MSFIFAMLIAVLIDIIIGWPKMIYRKIGHPVTWVGHCIFALEARFNTGSARAQRVNGIVTALVIILGVILVAFFLLALLPKSIFGTIILGILAWPFVAVRSLHEHVRAIEAPLRNDDIKEARYAVSMIVGRNPEALDARGIIRATIESLAENTSDGIIAPLFWGALLGLPGIAGYKTINTLDSMIGHKNDRYLHFGRFSAITDDVVNWIPARITGLLFALCGPAPKPSLKTMCIDAKLHRSPNAGWPEAAMAASLNISLSGPRIYNDELTEEPWIHAKGRDAITSDISEALQLYRRSILAFMGLLIATATIG